MFERLDETGEPILFRFNGRDIPARSGDSVASALLAAGQRVFRETPGSGAPRGPFCMMGACYECLVQIDGQTVQACMTRVAPGLDVSAPRTPREEG